MIKINKCNICGVVPNVNRSHSRRMISHKCKDYHSGWSNLQAVVKDWNENNPPKEEENSNNTTKDTICQLVKQWIKLHNYDPMDCINVEHFARWADKQ